MSSHGYLDLFRHQEFRALWIGSALGIAAATVASLGLGTLVYAQTGSPLLTAATMFGPSLVQLLGASTLMSAADTIRPRHALPDTPPPSSNRICSSGSHHPTCAARC